ncbi:hypothetical protein ACFWMJ_23495 [Streptomyces hawaiiensis]|uniref:hypothetical protein n=1 Tax=Streptomyces hawaiiensis TaxID=67305 RepID=UPI003648D7A1
MAETSKGQSDEGTLTYRGKTWEVTSEPTVVDSEGEEDLVEVWIRRGEGIGEPR